MQVLCISTARIPHTQCWRMHKTKISLSGFDYASESLYDGRQEILFGHGFFSKPFLWLCAKQSACHLGEVYGRLKGSLLLSLSP